jgi:hypothetical protein
VGFLHLALGDEAQAALWLDRGAVLLQSQGTARELFSEFVPLARHRSNPARLMRLVQGVSPALFGPFGTQIFRKILLPTGTAAEIRPYYEAIWPGLFVDEPAVRVFNMDIVPDVAWMRRSAGEVEQADNMLLEALEALRTNDWVSMFPSDAQISITEVEILASLGREDEAIRALRRKVDEGWRFGWWLAEDDPVLATIRERPEFIAMMTEIKADMAQQRARMPRYEPATAAAGPQSPGE